MRDTTQTTANPWLRPRRGRLDTGTSTSAPVLSVGTMNFGKRTAPDESERIVARALERGLVFFDTANVYNEGESERILGRALGARRERCFVATKVGLWGMPRNKEGLGKATLLRAIDDSLSRLGTDYVDVYYLHAPDPGTPVEETLDAMKALLDAGKVRAWGVSNYAAWQILEMSHLADARGMPRPVLSQVIYNVLIRQIEVEYLRFAEKHPIHTTVYNPLAGGLLTGKRARGEVPKGSRFDGNRMYQRRYWSDRFFDQLDALTGVAREEGVSLVSLAYGWVAAQKGVDSILVGPASVEQLDQAIEACHQRLSPAALARIDEIQYALSGTDAKYAR
jgi:aryl-alcohol dehydrogenase-like predicted oxidoreductase